MLGTVVSVAGAMLNARQLFLILACTVEFRSGGRSCRACKRRRRQLATAEKNLETAKA
jgi:hypothetical protein